MLYIHHSACISPQQSFGNIDIESLNESVNNQLSAMQPVYEGIPSGLIRRMGKAVKMGVGAALSLLANQPPPSGIIIGTAHGGMEDCIKFLTQIVEYEEGILAPGNFVQSTANAIASQLGLLRHNHAYNITHVHRGLAFENALLDAMMLVREFPGHTYLLGGVDEISNYNYNIDFLDGWFKKDPLSNSRLYETDTNGSLAGEGAAMFLVNGNPEGALAAVKAIQYIHSEDENKVAETMSDFIKTHAGGQPIHWLLSGENGDQRFQKFYNACESQVKQQTGICRFKHMVGEFPTASALAVWIACYILHKKKIPGHMVKREPAHAEYRNLLIYNSFKEYQHSFILINV